MMLCQKLIIRRNGMIKLCTTAAFYSKRSDSEIADVYKVVKSGQAVDDIGSTTFVSSPNWELLAPRGYRFYLPGSIGPAWHDASTIAQVEDVSLLTSQSGKIIQKGNSSTFEYVTQECPLLLRTGVIELFPGTDIGDCELTVVTLMHKPDTNRTLQTPEIDIAKEKIAQCFVLAAQEICNKLKMAGFWADFINPFSGRPYLSSFQNMTLYETDEKFRCLGFQIENHSYCRVIANEDKRTKSFVGSLFTTAPASVTKLKDVLNQYE